VKSTAAALVLGLAVGSGPVSLVACGSSGSGNGGGSSSGSSGSSGSSSGGGEVDGGDAGVSAYCIEAGYRGDGSRFTDLYRDFFGPSGGASCSARSICHVEGGTGFLTSGYECAPDQNGCWASMTSSIVPDGGTSMPETTRLYMALRKAPPTPGSGPMPRNSTYAFCPADLERISTWIQNGAHNN
jgi:hypothetical protein